MKYYNSSIRLQFFNSFSQIIIYNSKIHVISIFYKWQLLDVDF